VFLNDISSLLLKWELHRLKDSTQDAKEVRVDL